MASKTKKSQKMNSKQTKRTKNTKKKKNTKKSTSFLQDEIIIWISLAVAIFCTVSNFGLVGFVGDFVAEKIQFVFGWMAYVVPALAFCGISFYISNRKNSTAYIKLIAGAIATIQMCVFLQLINDCGGWFGSVICDYLVPAIGVFGTFIVGAIIMIIASVILTEKSLLRGVKKGSEKAYDFAKEDARRRREAAKEKKELRREEQQKQRRIDKHVSGVSLNTILVDEKPEDPVVQIENDIENDEFVLDDVVINRATPLDMKELLPEPEALVDIREEDIVPEFAQPVEKICIKEEVEQVAKTIENTAPIKKDYKLPPLTLLKKGKKSIGDSDGHLRETALKLQKTLKTFGVNVTVTNISCGPSVTRFELQPEMGVKVSKIVGLADDIKLNLAAADIRIEAPIPGKAAVGIEVPNKENEAVMLRDLLESQEFKSSKSKISFATGRDIAGKVVVSDIAKMPHVLIAGATGSGKSVCINTLIMSILYKAKPDEVKLIMIDPKVVELSVYNGIPHLMIPVVTDPKKAAGALNWAVAEMTKRYQLFAEYGVRDIKGYNDKISDLPPVEGREQPQKMPQIVIIVDELADLMMVAPGEVEDAICRLAQLARAAGIHLVLATQRPSVNVITGLIKANMPSRIAFSVSSGVDSRTIIDMNGAEKLLGKGDMLFYPTGYQKPVRVQGAFVSDKEVEAVVSYLKENSGQIAYDEDIQNQVNSINISSSGYSESSLNERDVYFVDAGKLVIEKDKASIGMLQRVFKIGFNRAARIMDQLCEAGVVGEEEGTKPRKVLMSLEEFERYIDEYV